MPVGTFGKRGVEVFRGNVGKTGINFVNLRVKP